MLVEKLRLLSTACGVIALTQLALGSIAALFGVDMYWATKSFWAIVAMGIASDVICRLLD